MLPSAYNLSPSKAIILEPKGTILSVRAVWIATKILSPVTILVAIPAYCKIFMIKGASSLILLVNVTNPINTVPLRHSSLLHLSI